jgi:hypothetical protein
MAAEEFEPIGKVVCWHGFQRLRAASAMAGTQAFTVGLILNGGLDRTRFIP